MKLFLFNIEIVFHGNFFKNIQFLVIIFLYYIAMNFVKYLALKYERF